MLKKVQYSSIIWTTKLCSITPNSRLHSTYEILLRVESPCKFAEQLSPLSSRGDGKEPETDSRIQFVPEQGAERLVFIGCPSPQSICY